ncbi:MAG: hypothetical protein KKE17_12330 [Proteobacteria bacterium]|nr:hypothetical protein [Pseudomonadota bacterium]MBU1710785.1 hypothetical protein [Pseudomonadota bacterium]
MQALKKLISKAINISFFPGLQGKYPRVLLAGPPIRPVQIKPQAIKRGRRIKPCAWGLFILFAVICVASEGLAFWPFTPLTKQQVVPMQIVREPAEPQPDKAEEFTAQVREMADQLFSNLTDADPEAGDLAEGLVICTFVDLKKLYRTSSFGRYIAEQLMGEFQKKKFSVVELRKSNSVMIQEKKGEYGLSRNPDEISTVLQAGAMLTGTYTAMENHIIVNARILDNRSAEVLSSATIIFPRDQFSATLLADSSSAMSSKRTLVYKKELEL